MLTIAVDAMGGDHGPRVTIPAALEMLKKHPNLELIMVGDQSVLRKYLRAKRALDTERLTIQHASQQVEMDEPPSQALRTKKDSSMRVAINLVKEGRAQACVSAGNTGALMATARFVLKTVPNVNRPALISVLPTDRENEDVRVLDLGANVDSSPEQLVEFAVMGSVLTSAIEEIDEPRVGLLNVGEEEIKGNDLVKKAAELLTNLHDINYVGFVEGDHIYRGSVDVVVCDGFVGNVALKASEGLAKMLLQQIKDGFNRNWLTKLSGLAALHVLKNVAKRTDPARYNGASFLGLQGIVIKSHGNANVMAYQNAIKEAMLEVEKDVPQRISRKVGKLLQREDA